MSFSGLGLDEALSKAVSLAFNIEKPTNIQELVLNGMLTEGSDGDIRDVLIRSKTGSGKTLAFCLPIIHRLLLEQRQSEASDTRSLGTLALIIVPTRELATQTQETLCKLLGKLNGKNHWLVSSSLSGGDRRKSEKERLRKGVHLVVGTPGRILDHLSNTESWLRAVRSTRWLVVDEADRLLDAGFERTVREIMEKVEGQVSRAPQLILCSATINEKQSEVFGHQLRNPQFFTESSVAAATPHQVLVKSKPNLAHPLQLEHLYCCTPTKFRLSTLLGILAESSSRVDDPSQKLVLFTICCDTVDFLYAALKEKGLNLLPSTVQLYKLHGNLEHKERISTFTAFTRQTGSCLLICTDVAARGLNLTNVAAIIQYDAPCDVNDYVHRAGRTARQESPGKSIIFLMPSEREYVPLLQSKGLSIKSLSWEPLAERFLKLQKPSAVTKPVDDVSEDEDALNVDADLKGRNLIWVDNLQEQIKKRPELLQLAKTAYLSFVRAYATHPAAEKSIFHIKKLHLGHLAAIFLLSGAPKSVMASTMVNKRPNSHSQKDGNAQKRPMLPKKRMHARKVSEFDAGDANASFMQPRSSGKSSQSAKGRRKQPNL